eukprot:7763034-Heterocapsa_arctica.AAC.1
MLPVFWKPPFPPFAAVPYVPAPFHPCGPVAGIGRSDSSWDPAVRTGCLRLANPSVIPMADGFSSLMGSSSLLVFLFMPPLGVALMHVMLQSGHLFTMQL